MIQNAAAMKPARRFPHVLPAILLLLPALALPASARAAASPGPAAPPRIRIELNHFLELHHFLLTQTKGGAARPEYAPAVQAYAAVLGSAAGKGVWQVVGDACVQGPDAAAIAARGRNLPASLQGADREAARSLLEALGAAWPLYEKLDWPERNRSLQRARQELLRGFSNKSEAVLMPALHERFLLQPLDQPITVFPVGRSTRTGDSGTTDKGHYLVQPIGGVSVLEAMMHELTHILDMNQPPARPTLLRRIVEQAKGIDPATIDAFAHGLIVWNAHALVKRHVNPGLRPLFPGSMTPFLGIYEAAWTPWLEGRAGADETIDRLVQELARSNPAGTSSPTASSR